MRVDSFDFDLPESLIAKVPLDRRDSSRLLVLQRNGSIEHRIFCNITQYLREGDLLILNNSKVNPVRLSGRKSSGGKIDIVLTKKLSHDTYSVLTRGSYSGKVYFQDGLEAELTDGSRARFSIEDVSLYLLKHGNMPLPPYIRRRPDQRDRAWYQTVYAEEDGSIAAPTAGLHFTRALLTEIASIGVTIQYVTLHVGIGTFQPIRVENVRDHRMEPEEFELNLSLKQLISDTKRRRRKVFAVGTTTTRAIEAFMIDHFTGMRENGSIKGITDLFISPGYTFRGIDALITNFHLPRSTPLMLVSALTGKENVQKVYEEAIASHYRFFSYGDAMLIP
jgi:S-adenosylmethionine:tRNA ribosyltransferase-isomerase